MIQTINLYSIKTSKRQLFMLEFDNIKSNDTYLKRYCARFKEYVELTLYEISKKYDWKSKVFHRKIRKTKKVLMLFSMYSVDSKHKFYEKYCRAKMMLHHFFFSINLENLFKSNDDIIFSSWQAAYNHCRKSHQHSFDSLSVMLEDVLEKSETKSISDNEKNLENIQHEEILNKRNSQRNEVVMKLECDLKSRVQNLQHNWLANKESYDVNMFKDYLKREKCTMKFKSTSQTFEEANDSSILNLEQRALFDRILNHYMSSSKKQLLLHVDDETKTKKSLCIEMIFSHMNYYAHQREEFNSVLRAAFIEVVAHNISDNTLHQLLSLSIQTQFNELKQNRLTRLQRSFRHCKLLIIDEKFMIDLRLLYKLNCRLRAICAKSNRFFDEMNIMLCDDFAQLSLVEDTSIYSQSRISSLEMLIVQIAYRAFDQFIFLIKLMRQNEDSSTAQRFRETLNEMRDEFISLFNWQFLQTRSRKRLTSKKWIRFDNALRLYARNVDFSKYNLQALKRFNRSVIKINANHQEKKASEKSNENAERLSKEFMISVNFRVM